MTAIWFVGDAITAMGYRLAGAAVVSPEITETRDALARVMAEQPLVVLLSAEHASELEPAERAALLGRTDPLVWIVPDVQGRAAFYDVARRARAVLGSEP
jgi:vacuolar-type H+-ATPase subunit F/Vma7